jgi:hypothetical protein
MPTTSVSMVSTMSADARRYLEAALDVMQRHALNRANLDWPAIRRRALSDAFGAMTPSDTYSAIELALAQLHDNAHSTLMPPASNAASGGCAGTTLPSGRLLQGQIGYVALPHTCSVESDRRYRAAATDAIQDLQPSAGNGWILDLRNDNGCHVWPMLAGIQPLLGTTLIGYFVEPGAVRFAAHLTPTEATVAGKVQIRMPAPTYPVASGAPVVVLTGPQTDSSGEFVAIAFRGRPCTTSMGAPTHGQPTGNDEYRLSDGAALIITTTLEADRSGHLYPDAPIQPDTIVANGRSFATFIPSDPTIKAAVHWLDQHRGCRG